MEMTSGEWQIDDVGYGRSKDRSTYLKKPGRNRIRVRLFVRTVEERSSQYSLHIDIQIRATQAWR